MGFYKKGLYRKKPVIIEAEQLAETIEIETLEGIMIGRDGDWLITGVAGEKYPCRDDIFRDTYEPVFRDTYEPDEIDEEIQNKKKKEDKSMTTKATPTDVIRDLEYKLMDKEYLRTRIVEQLLDINIEKSMIVEKEYQETKTPELSNAQKRANAIEQLIRDDERASSLRFEQNEIELDIKKLKIEISFYRRLFHERMITTMERIVSLYEFP